MVLKRPREPLPGDCCGNGCARCVWDVYYDKLAEYEASKGDNDEDSEDESYSESESSDDLNDNYVGSVVVKYVSLEHPKDEKSIMDEFQSRYMPITDVKLGLRGGSVCVLDMVTKHDNTAFPGDIANIFVPNNVQRECGQSLVDEICSVLNVNPDQCCELHRSPFVPENNFPPWLPLRQPISIRDLLTYYVDLSTSSFLHPSFFQSLQRLHLNNTTGAVSRGPFSFTSTPDVLARCCSPDCTGIIRHLAGSSSLGCFPSIIDVLNVFSFVSVPLERFLEISSRLRPRKFSIVSQRRDPTNGSLITRLCMRKTEAPRETRQINQENLSRGDIDTKQQQTAEVLSSLVCQAALERSPQPFFFGHVSLPLTRWSMGTKSEHPLYLGLPPSGSTAFSKRLSTAVTPVVSSSGVQRLPHRLFLIGMGTGMAPLMSAIFHLYRGLFRGKQSLEFPLDCTVLYGARNKEELIFHPDLVEAFDNGLLSQYSCALSKENLSPAQFPSAHWSEKKHVTEILMTDDRLQSSLMSGLISGDAVVFACGPSGAMTALREWIACKVTAIQNDGGATMELIEHRQQVLFDEWNSVDYSS